MDKENNSSKSNERSRNAHFTDEYCNCLESSYISVCEALSDILYNGSFKNKKDDDKKDINISKGSIYSRVLDRHSDKVINAIWDIREKYKSKVFELKLNCVMISALAFVVGAVVGAIIYSL